MFKGRGILFFSVLFLIFSFSNNVSSENIKIKSDNIKLQSASGSSKASSLNTGEVKISTSSTNGLDVGQSQITLQGANAQSIKAGTLNTTTSIAERVILKSSV